MIPFSNTPKKPENKGVSGVWKFIICTQDFSGLGFAKMLLCQTEGVEVLLAVQMKDDEDNEDAFRVVGTGITDIKHLDDVFKSRKQYKDWCWVFDQNHNHEIADKLREEGFVVLGGHAFTDKLEHDRNFGLSIVQKAGIATPPSFEFNDIASGAEFLDKNEMTAYVFKPDEPDNEAWVTTAPENDNDCAANRELYKFLSSQGDGQGSYILQERKKGVEINIEYFLYKGKPIFAHANFECKRKDNGDLGRMIGCSQDIDFSVPLHCKILRETLDKMLGMSEFKDYTGFMDGNYIIADNQYWFLEWCGRFGYNAHPNLFLTLAISPLAEILSDWATGNVENFDRHFRAGFGASITCWIDKPVMGLPLIFDDGQDTESRFFHFDTYCEDDEYYLAGYANEVGIQCAHDYDIHSAAEEVLRKFYKIHYPGKTARTDLSSDNYQSNPEERFIACEAMRLFQ